MVSSSSHAADPALSPNALERSQTGDRPLAETGLVYHVASTLDEVVAAWRLVYHSYRRAGLIPSNALALHTLPQAVGPHAVVAYGRIGPVVASTLSAYTDEAGIGLPLDSAYPDELAQLRDQGRRLAEIGLLADRRAEHKRSLNSLFDLMRFGVLYAIHRNADDVVIGVHPRHAPFYNRLIGFTYAGPERTYATVNDHAVVLMRLNLRSTPHEPRLPRGLKYFLDNPVPAQDFDRRFAFPAEVVDASDVAAYLVCQERQPAL